MRFESDRRRRVLSHMDVLTDFYREEFIKHRECLEQQRDVYSDRAIDSFEQALRLVLNQLDQLCEKADAEIVVRRLLRKFDALTGLSAYSAWSDHPTQFH